MKLDIHLPVALALLTPMTAFAIQGPVETFLVAGGGGAVGGFLGALLACWLCKRRGSRTPDPKKY